MTAEPPDSPVTEAARSLEVRWIFPGQIESAVAGWFGRFPAGRESREDTYLLDPQLRGLSVKIRGGGALEVKAYRGSPGILEVAGRARGRIESWQKWSFPLRPPRDDRGGPPGWTPVAKRRRISQFSSASGPAMARGLGMGQQPRCVVELTEVRARGQDWWTLGFEASGAAGLLRRELEAAAALVFAQALPGGVVPGPADSRSYAQWLGQRPGGGSDAGALRLSPAGPAGPPFSSPRPAPGPQGNALMTAAGHIEAVASRTATQPPVPRRAQPCRAGVRLSSVGRVGLPAN
jgi:hypothetical protein